MFEDDEDTIYDRTIHEIKKSPLSLLNIPLKIVLGFATILGGIVAWGELKNPPQSEPEKTVIYMQDKEPHSDPSISKDVKDARIEPQAGKSEAQQPIIENQTGNAISKTFEEKSEPVSFDYTSFLNTNFKNSPASTEVAVTITSKSGNVLNSEANAIAGIYTQTGNKGFIGLFRSSFIKKSGFQELREGNSDILEKLGLESYTDYVALGTIDYSFRDGTLVDGTIVCTITLKMDILSTSSQSIFKSFSISSINGNGATEDQAKENAFQKVLNTYYSQYSSL
ncbi:MAG: hypothetical protein H6563_11720 [Lewinellaceae bacterium]|nr:hypothetical protein [Lewinellaceae bacterium]